MNETEALSSPMPVEPSEPQASVPAPGLALVLGLGESGLAMARWLARLGHGLRVADTRTAPGGLDALRALAPEADLRLGLGQDGLQDGMQDELLAGVGLIALSPGLSPNQEPARSLLAAAQAAGIAVASEIELFAQALARLREEQGYAPKLLAVTGTNGKTTVTRLTGLLCERAGKKTSVAGNISPAALDALAAALDAGELPEVWVLELSSFQLENTRSLVPDAAAVLNLTQDHLDWHGSMQAYGAAKARIFGPGTVRVLNRDDAAVLAMADAPGDESAIVTFGADEPKLPGHFGLENAQGMRWLAECVPAVEVEAPPKRVRRGKAPPEPIETRLNRLMPADALRIRGQHNALNTLAALALARAIDLPYGPLLRAVREYAGEPHRVQFLRSIGGVDYIEDSKGTNVGATLAALEGLGQRVVLIAGGDGKGQDFSPLARPVALHARAVLLIGRDAPAVEAALAGSGVPLERAESLEAAVRRAAELAQPGDAVLLSPACASLDMFRDYKHRAEVFARAVDDVALDRGEVA
jgi:UDP-N-acetylmuramoylalanine--D-glutamate ligase